MPEIPQTLAQRLNAFARDIKLSHTVFAMPWAILSAIMAWRVAPENLALKLGLVVLCMVSARTVAMSANRLLDARLDALNPRTAGRAIPAGRLGRGFYVGALAGCTAVFLVACALFLMLLGNPWPLILAPPVLAFLAAYPLLKRFTALCHYYLGAALGLAPVCAWVAVAGRIEAPPLLMGLAVLLWTAGFDIIYAAQDYWSDRQTGVVSLPVRLGIGQSLWVARATHAACLAALAALGASAQPLAALYWIGVGAAALLLIVEHALVRADDLSKVNVAFFTVNGIISVLVGTLGVVDVLT